MTMIYEERDKVYEQCNYSIADRWLVQVINSAPSMR